MHYLIIHYCHPNTVEFTNELEALFALTGDIRILSSSASFRRQEGVVLVAWNGMIDLAFLQHLNSTLDVLDYTIVSAPPEVSGVFGGEEPLAHAVVSPPIPIGSDEDEPPMVLRGPFPRWWDEEGHQ